MTLRIFILISLALVVSGGCSQKEESRIEINKNPGNTAKTSADSPPPSKYQGLPKVTVQQYEQIKIGMTKAEVEKILGPGKPAKDVSINNVSGDAYQWSVADFMMISIIFKDDTVKGISEDNR